MIRDMKTQIIGVRTGNRETIRDITRDCAEFVSTAADGDDGLLHVFVPHATAGIAVIELGARSDDDLLAALAELLPADDVDAAGADPANEFRGFAYRHQRRPTYPERVCCQQHQGNGIRRA